MITNLPVAAELLGLLTVGVPDKAMRFDFDSGRMTDEQLRDNHTERCPDGCAIHSGELLWRVYALAQDVARPEVIEIRVPAPQQPSLTMLTPLAVDNLSTYVKVDKASKKLAQNWSATAVRDAGPPARRNGHAEKAEHQPA